MHIRDLINKVSKKAAAVLDRIMDLLAGAAGVLLILIMLLVSYLVVMRYSLGRPPGWVVEICQYMIVALTFLAAPWLLREGGHVRVDIVLAFLSAKTNTILSLITSIAGILISLILALYGALSTWQHFTQGITVIEILRIPKAPLLSLIPIGFFLLSMQFLRQAYGHCERLREIRRQRSKEPGI
ncbi:MAG: TRAP transporter small permease [Deltaproteobacteria bacterium]|jgi:C4-dicarboxylate transporter DctQ subunit